MWLSVPLIVVIVSLCIQQNTASEPSPRLFDWTILQNVHSKIEEAESSDANRLIVVAVDGFRHDFMTAELTPFMYFVANLGVWAPQGLQPQIWTETAANFVSLTTGLNCEQHGIVGNFFYDPKFNEFYDYWNFSKIARFSENAHQSKYYTGVPIWQLLEAGKAGAVRWPTCDVPYNDKPMGKYCVPPLFNSESWDEEIWEQDVDQLMAWLHSPENKIQLGMMYIPEPDATEHHNDIFNQNVKDVIRKIDNTMQYMFLKLAESGTLAKTNVIILADHGFTNTFSPSTDIRLDKVFAENDLHYIRSVNSLFPVENTTADQLYNALKEYQRENPSFDVWKKEDLPVDFHYNNRRVGDVVVLEKLGYHAVFDYIAKKDSNASQVVGEHGFSKYYPEMHPLFMAFGPDLQRGFVIPETPVFDNTGVYPVMCRLLGLTQNKCNHKNTDLSIVMNMFRDKSWIK